MKVTLRRTRCSLMRPLSTCTSCEATQAAVTFLSVLVARLMPFSTASAYPFFDEEISSVTRATAMASPSDGLGLQGCTASCRTHPETNSACLMRLGWGLQVRPHPDRLPPSKEDRSAMELSVI